MSSQPHILSGFTLLCCISGPSPRSITARFSVVEEHLCRSSVNHRLQHHLASQAAPCPFPLLLKPPILLASEIRKDSTHWAFSSDSGPFPLQKKTNDHDLTRLLRPDAAAMQRTLELVRAPNQSACRVTLPGVTENAAAAYLRICPDRVDPELQQNPYPDSCQGLPMSN